MNLGGIPARLLSLGTIDFGIIVNGAILMAEAILSQSEARFGESFTEDILGGSLTGICSDGKPGMC
jgi:cobalt-zinc-cadmium resistance protein CzcA